jgi:hypothetical protein
MLAPDCLGDACISVRPPVQVGGVIGGGSGGAAGDGGGGGAGAAGIPGAALGTLSGTVRGVSSPDLRGTLPLTTALDVRAAGSSESLVSARTTAEGSFRVEQVRLDPALWVGVGAFDDDSASLYVDTLQLVDSSAAGGVRLVVLQRVVMEQIAQNLSGAELDPGRAYAFVTFLGEDGGPLPDVAITFPASADVSIGYDNGDIYNDQTGGTSVRGTAVLLNLPAPAYPGGATQVTAESSTLPFNLELQVARGSVTLATVQASP